MAKLIRNVADMATADRRTLEHLIGEDLRESQQVVIDVLDLPAGELDRPRPAQSLEDWANIYDGLTDAEIEAVDKIAKTRANLTRNPP